MRSRVLLMVFLNADGKKINVRMPYVKEDLTKEIIADAMDTIIAENILIGDGLALVKKVGAKVTTQEVDRIL